MGDDTRESQGWTNFVRDMAVMFFLIFAARSAFADWYRVPTGSMKPTILEGDRVFVNRVAYDLKVPFTRFHLLKWGDPQRGQVVVLHSPKDETRLIKRVVAVPGDRIEIRNQSLRLNDKLVAVLPVSPEEIAGLDGLQDRDRFGHVFALESLPGKTHPVMHRAPSNMRGSYDIEVPEGFYFVMGDNRDNSADSRVFGLVERDLIVGHAKRVLISFDHESFMSPRWDRFFESLE